VTVPDVQRPGEARTLHLAGAAQCHGHVGRFAGRRKECFWIYALAYAAGTPRSVILSIPKSPKKSRVSFRGCDLLRAWQSCPCHTPTSPVGPASSKR
jgi:hypothetical protein